MRIFLRQKKHSNMFFNKRGTRQRGLYDCELRTQTVVACEQEHDREHFNHSLEVLRLIV
jgi:hypothetical protein